MIVKTLILLLLTCGLPCHSAMSKTEKPTNRLIHEKSPYLLQHANNPVDWYPWGEEAFKKAENENKPIFLSIGYATCHWCHVMEHESFEDIEIANFLNEHFVPIKVDREERTDVDHVYMSAVQRMTGAGGWPLSVFLTPDKKPFFGGTYFPPRPSGNRPGFLDIIQTIHKKWLVDQEKIQESGDTFVKGMRDELNASIHETAFIDESIFAKAFNSFNSRYDKEYGGFLPAPKFPRPHVYLFLLRYSHRSENKRALEIVEESLKAMARGGIQDHLAGGFHRYSTDKRWFVPHFEKMLYDQALLARIYLEAYQATKDVFYKDVAFDIFDYVLGNLTDKEGGFYSAEDADSFETHSSKLKTEGAFYVWSYSEIEEILGEQNAEILSYYFGMRPEGNVENDPHQMFLGKNILSVKNSIEQTSETFAKKTSDIEQIVHDGKPMLLQHRNERPRPLIDDKILTNWNALMISSLSYGFRITGEHKYLKAAEAATAFILENLRSSEGLLLHTYRDGEAKIDGYLDDYAFFSEAMLELHQATQNPLYLRISEDIATNMIDLFYDRKRGGFFYASNRSEELIIKPKRLYDGAMPSSNSAALFILAKLYKITANPLFSDRIEESLGLFSTKLTQNLTGYPHLLNALFFWLGPTHETVLVGSTEEELFQSMKVEINKAYLPFNLSIHRPIRGKSLDAIVELAPFLKAQVMINEQPTAYVCKDRNCRLPTNDTKRMMSYLTK